MDHRRIEPGGAVGDAAVACAPPSAASISRIISARKESSAAAVASIVSGRQVERAGLQQRARGDRLRQALAR